MPPLPSNQKSRLGSGKTKRVNQETGNNNGSKLSVRGTKKKRALSSARPRMASANMRSSRASNMKSGSGKGDSKQNSKKSSLQKEGG